MLPHFAVLKGLLKLDVVKIDNTVFRLHYKLTVIFLAASCILVTLKQYIGDPINCYMSDGPGPLRSGKVIDSYCWIHSTFTLHNRDGPIPGLGATRNEDGKLADFRTHTYYQWVGFVLVFLTVLFYIPRWIWKTCEAGRMKALVEGLTSPIAHQKLDGSSKSNNETEQKNDNNNNQDRLVSYIISNLGKHNLYAASFFLCEALNLLNVTSQVYFLGVFFDGELTVDGIVDFLGNPSGPLLKVFPLTSKCTIYNYGPSGADQTWDAHCILPINIINEKIYYFLWIWFTALSALSGLAIIYRLVVLLSSKFRTFLFLRFHPTCVSTDRIEVFLDQCGIGDWFVLQLIGQNVNNCIMQEVLVELGDRIQERKKEIP